MTTDVPNSVVMDEFQIQRFSVQFTKHKNVKKIIVPSKFPEEIITVLNTKKKCFAIDVKKGKLVGKRKKH